MNVIIDEDDYSKYIEISSQKHYMNVMNNGEVQFISFNSYANNVNVRYIDKSIKKANKKVKKSDLVCSIDLSKEDIDCNAHEMVRGDKKQSLYIMQKMMSFLVVIMELSL